MIFEGIVYRFGDDINTDEIIPARYLNSSDPRILAEHCMEDARPGFVQTMDKGGIIVAGENFGCGSSREHAPIAIKAAGISCVVAASFARIFFRNAINIGLPIVECPEIVENLHEGDRVRVDLQDGIVTSGSQEVQVAPFSEFMQEIITKGGLLPYLQEVPL